MQEWERIGRIQGWRQLRMECLRKLFLIARKGRFGVAKAFFRAKIGPIGLDC